jgi:hypothetical protein
MSSALCAWSLLAVHVGWCLCVTAAVCAWHMIYVYDNLCMYNVQWPLVSVHYWWCVYESCSLYMTAAACAWQIAAALHDSCGLTWQLLPCMIAAALHDSYCLAWQLLPCMTTAALHDSSCLCITAATCAWPLLSFHGCSCLYMTKAVYYLWPEYWGSAKRIWVICMSSAIMYSGCRTTLTEYGKRNQSISFVVTSITIHVEQIWAQKQPAYQAKCVSYHTVCTVQQFIVKPCYFIKFYKLAS